MNTSLSTGTSGRAYAIVTPARDEKDNLKRLAECLVSQVVTPNLWIIVDDGSSDGTKELIGELAQRHDWIRRVDSGGAVLQRGAPIVRAFHLALEKLDPMPDVVVKLDADISMDADHFSRLLEEFERDPSLGIAAGSGYERDGEGVWRQRHGTGPAVWGACRAYRRECLDDILPLEEHMGWDTLDLMKANMKGWKTEVFYDLPFRHHRVEGERDGHPLRTSMIQGRAAYFMGYRPSYLALRTMFRVARNPAAFGLLLGYARARAMRYPRCGDSELIAYIRSEQSLRKIPVRAREALRPRAALSD